MSTNLDDSSSTTSRTSGSYSNKCRRCGEPESLPSKPLIKCPSCNKKRLHPHCHQPPVDARNIPKDWKCKACMDAASGSTLPKAPSNGYSAPPPSLMSVPSIKMNARLCKEPGCDRPIFQQNTLQLCHFHKIQQQHKNATAKKPAGALITGPGSKPIKKKSLYNFKSEQSLKRKRTAPAKRSVSDNALPVLNGLTMEHPKKPSQQRPTSATSYTPSFRQSLRRTPDRRGTQFNLLAEMGSDPSPTEEDLDISLGSESMTESPISLLNGERDFSIPNSASRTPFSIGEQPSPEYSPPPPAEVNLREVTNLWAEPNLTEDSPGSQINQELRATADQAQDPQGTDRDFGLKWPPIRATLNPVQERSEREEGSAVAADQDEEMPDVSVISTVNEESGDGTASQQVHVSPSPALTSTSSPYTSAEDMTLDADATTNALEELPLEALRMHKAVTFDTSELDFFLTKQAEPESDAQPTPQELAETQIWGHIDPRKVWPKEMSEEELAEKRREIDARGGRKANHGKLLTAQVRKERMEKGWHIHQTSEATPDHIISEAARTMEELFGFRGIDDLIPGLRDGQLVMMEKPVDDTGKKKRKSALKYYPVL